jgi:peptide/nickel transport system permease protein
MLPFFLKRSGQLLITLLGITVLTFGIMHLAPGEPTVVQSEMNPKVSAQAREQLRKLYGLDQPLWKQYRDWLGRLARFDFGNTFTDGRPVVTVIAEKIPITLTINVLSLLLIVGVSLPIGIYAAVHHHAWFDKATTVFVFLGFAMPTFWLALLLMLLFGIYLGWLPISGYETLGVSMSFGDRLIDWGRHLLLPVFVSAFGGLAGFSRYVRSSMLEVTLQDYIRTAKAKGLDERTIVFKHAFRNALIPIVTLLGLSVPGLIGGSVIFETIYAIPGMGQLFYQAVTARDYPVVMGLTVIGAILTLLGNFAADLSYALVNPKVKSAAGSER